MSRLVEYFKEILNKEEDGQDSTSVENNDEDVGVPEPTIGEAESVIKRISNSGRWCEHRID